MATRTTYYELTFNVGELKAIEEATSSANGITEADLTLAEAHALDRVNQVILRVCGAVKGASIVAEFLDDTNDLDPIITQLAELIAAAEVLEKWERFNYSKEAREDRRMTSGIDVDHVRGRATQIVKDILDAGGTFKTDGTFRRWVLAPTQQGPRVSGPLVKGSYFDPRGYTDPWGRQYPGPPDPYGVAKGL